MCACLSLYVCGCVSKDGSQTAGETIAMYSRGEAQRRILER